MPEDLLAEADKLVSARDTADPEARASRNGFIRDAVRAEVQRRCARCGCRVEGRRRAVLFEGRLTHKRCLTTAESRHGTKAP